MSIPTYAVIDKVEELHEDGKVIGRVITDKAGNRFNVKKGQGGKLKDRWYQLDEGIGLAFEFKTDTFKGYDFVSDFTQVADRFEQKAAQKVSTELKDDRQARIEQDVAIKEIGEDWRAGKRKDNDILVLAREAWLIDKMNYKGVEATEDKLHQSLSENIRDNQDKPNLPEIDDQLDRIRELVIKVGWVKTKKINFTNCLRRLFNTTEIEELTQAELDKLEQELTDKLKVEP